MTRSSSVMVPWWPGLPTGCPWSLSTN